MEKETEVYASEEGNDSFRATAVTPTLTRRNGVNKTVSDNNISYINEKSKYNNESFSVRNCKESCRRSLPTSWAVIWWRCPPTQEHGRSTHCGRDDSRNSFHRPALSDRMEERKLPLQIPGIVVY